MKKRIAHISTAHYSDDPRIVYKECYSLAKKYNVYLFCLKGANTDSLSRKGITFNPLKKNRKLIRRIFGNQFRVLSLCKKHSIEVAHLHDPELILSAFILKILGKEVIFDIHENFHRRTYKNKSLKFFFMNLFQKFYILLEKLAQYILDYIVVADDDIKRNFTGSNIEIIYNYPQRTNFLETTRNKIVYIGDISSNRGFEYFDRINLIAKKHNLDFNLYGRWQSPSRNYFCGYLNYDDIPILLQESVLGICLLKKTDNYMNAVPTKIFEYLSNGVPVICSDFDVIRRKFDEVEGMYYVDPDQFEENLDIIDKALHELRNNYATHKIIRESFNLKNYDWQSEEEKLFKVYSEILIENTTD